MKLVKNASGKTTVKLSKSEWANIGKKAGWLKKANITEERVLQKHPELKGNSFLAEVTQCLFEEDIKRIVENNSDLGTTEATLGKLHLSLCPICAEKARRIRQGKDQVGQL